MAGGGGGGDGEPEFQIAPMIDVLLVLLIFFMSITTSQVLKIDKDINLPFAADAKKKETSGALFEAALNVRWMAAQQEARIKLDTQELSNEEIVDVLSQRKAELDRTNKLENRDINYRVVIRGDRNVPWVEMQKVMTLIAQSGIDDISFSALNQNN